MNAKPAGSLQTLLGTVCSGLVLATGLLLTGCQKAAAPSASSGPIDGTYTLTKVDDKAVPTRIQHEGANLEIRSGAFTIGADGTCSSKMVFVPPNGKEATLVVHATYTRAGDDLTMRWENAGMTQGTVKGGIFTMSNEGMLLVYRK